MLVIYLVIIKRPIVLIYCKYVYVVYQPVYVVNTKSGHLQQFSFLVTLTELSLVHLKYTSCESV